MKKTTKRVLSAMMSTLMMFSLLPGVQTFASNSETGIARAAVQWEGRAFGQSTDLNFKSTIAPGKVGTNYAKGGQSIKVSNDGGATSETKEAIVVESRGGKIANTHDGLSFYYTKIPTSKNFKLSAKLYINQLGPEASVNTKTNTQEGCGVMVRDCVGQARKEPMQFGYEELPSASNVVSNWFQSNGKGIKVGINSVLYSRNGVTEPWGNTGVKKGTTKVAAFDADMITTIDRTPTDGVYDANKFVTVTLERVNDGFVTTYTNSDGTVTGTQKTDAANRVSVIDKDYMYAGFFASRNAKMTVTDVTLTTSDAKTEVKQFVRDAYSLSFLRDCASTTADENYKVRYFSNYAGKVTVKQDGKEVVKDAVVKAGEMIERDTVLTADSTDFEVVFTADSDKVEAAMDNFTVELNKKYANKDLYAAEDGTADAEGTKESPLSLQAALNHVSDNHTVFVKAGSYEAVAIDATLTASKGKKKSLVGYGYTDKAPVIIAGGTTMAASNWNIKNIHVTGGPSTGFRLSGSANTIEACKFYKNGDTGCQISGSGDPLTWPKDNYILNCESYSNVDTSRINADGFAAKLGVGTGNVFRGCISHNNADDGWDLFNKIEDGANCPITIDQCIAYENGILTKEMLGEEGVQSALGSIGNGFKLGGEGLPVNHVVTNSIAYKNNMDGFTCNFNPGQIKVTNCTSFDNARCNFIFRSNPYRKVSEQGIFTNCLSFRSNVLFETKDFISGTVRNSSFFFNGNDNFTERDFEGSWGKTSWERNQDGSIKFDNFLRVKRTSKLATAGVKGTYLGAIAPYNVNYTIAFNANGGSCVTRKTYNTGKAIQALPIPTRKGYTFAGWYTGRNDGYKVDAGSLYNEAASKTVYARWTANEYKVTFDANGGFMGARNIRRKTANVTFDGKLRAASAVTASKNGYVFTGWYTKKNGGTKVTGSTKFTNAGNMTVYAHYAKATVAKGSVRAAKNVSSKKIVVSAKTMKDVYAYQVRYSRRANFKGAKAVCSKNANAITVSNLQKGKTYYVQVRAFRYDSTGKKVYGNWSATKKVTVKK